MKRNLIYLTLVFLLGCVGFSSASHTYALNISELNVSGDGVRAFGQAYGNLNNNNVSTCSGNSECNLSYQILYDDMCYTWAGNGKYYTPTSSNYYTVINTSACQSPTTIGGYYYGAGSRDPRAEFSIQLDYGNYTMFVPGVSFANNGEGIDFGYIRGSQGKVVYSVPSRAGFVVEYGENSYTITKVFVYPNRFIFSTSDGSFMFEVGAGGTVANGFFVIDPSAVSNNFYFVDSVKRKAWSTTISSDLAWNLLLGNTAYWSVFSGGNFGNFFDTSYTLTTVAGGSIFPSGFGPGYQDTSFGFSYQEDLEFVSPGGVIDNDTSSTGGTISYSKDYLSCVQYYTQLDNLNTFYSRCGSDWRNGLLTGSSSDQLANMTALSNYFEDPSNGFNGTSFNNYNCDSTITIISGLNNLYGSNWSTVLDDYSMVGVSGNFDPSNFCQGAINDNSWVSMHNMIDYLAINGTGAVDCDAIDNLFDRLECQLGIGQYTSTQFDSIFDKFVGLIGIVVDKFFNLIEDGFNTGYHISGDSSRLSCSNSSVEIPYIDYVQYIALFFIILFFLKLI